MEIGRVERLDLSALDRSDTVLNDKFGKEGLTFDDVLLVPATESAPYSRTTSRPRPG